MTKAKKIAIYYHTHFGRNDGPPLYWYNAMRDMGLDVTHLAPEGDTKSFGKFDYHFWIDYGEDGLPTDKSWQIPKDGGKTVYVCSDAHIDDVGRTYRFKHAAKFDYVFFNQIEAMEGYEAFKAKKKQGQVVGFLPHAAEPKAYPKFDIVKKYDVCFIGHYQDVKNHNGFTRIEFLDAVFKAFPNFYFGTRTPGFPEKNMFEDASKRFGESRVVLNISIKDDINMRVFEALSSGSLLLTNEIPTLDVIGESGKHFVTYSTIDEAIKQIEDMLEHEDTREKIALAGHKHFLANHTYQSRIKQVFNLTESE
jgi:glycosyltransferase involved in cell wall biosynthesis